MKNALILTVALVVLTSSVFAGTGKIGSVGGSDSSRKTIVLNVPNAFAADTQFVANYDGSVTILNPTINANGQSFRAGAGVPTVWSDQNLGLCSLIDMNQAVFYEVASLGSRVEKLLYVKKNGDFDSVILTNNKQVLISLTCKTVADPNKDF